MRFFDNRSTDGDLLLQFALAILVLAAIAGAFMLMQQDLLSLRPLQIILK